VEGRVIVSTSKEPARIAGMFDAIAWRYDALNHLLSLGLDRKWRRRAVQELGLTGTERVLDVCTGTADLAIEAVGRRAGAARDVVGIDFAGQMLREAQRKLRHHASGRKIRLIRGDATHLPVPDRSFDAAMIAFGIRNVIDPAAACRELHRVLRPGSHLAILEFGYPRMPGIRTMYQWYFQYVLPRVGRRISRHQEAYAYLPQSVAEFKTPAAFTRMLQDAGFPVVRYVPLTLGTVYLYLAERD
jgi:demethylmenaquinone methyltransferase/2-methoxy-6-polyprenyl-1,4-benzoquinol methylase